MNLKTIHNERSAPIYAKQENILDGQRPSKRTNSVIYSGRNIFGLVCIGASVFVGLWGQISHTQEGIDRKNLSQYICREMLVMLFLARIYTYFASFYYISTSVIMRTNVLCSKIRQNGCITLASTLQWRHDATGRTKS